MMRRPFPSPLAAVFIAGTNRFTTQWYQALIGGRAPAIAAITVGASPFEYTAATEGYVAVKGGTVTSLEITRGADTIDVGVTAGCIPMSQGDILTITHAGAPTANFVAT